MFSTSQYRLGTEGCPEVCQHRFYIVLCQAWITAIWRHRHKRTRTLEPLGYILDQLDIRFAQRPIFVSEVRGNSNQT